MSVDLQRCSHVCVTHLSLQHGYRFALCQLCRQSRLLRVRLSPRFGCVRCTRPWRDCRVFASTGAGMSDATSNTFRVVQIQTAASAVIVVRNANGRKLFDMEIHGVTISVAVPLDAEIQVDPKSSGSRRARTAGQSSPKLSASEKPTGGNGRWRTELNHE
jgi:hypothetical protein